MNSRLWRISHFFYYHNMLALGRISEIIYNIVCGNGIFTRVKIGGALSFTIMELDV